jgi:hypothetical protein
VAGAVRRVEDLVVENGEVKGETETDGVGRSKLGLGDIGGVLGVLLAGLSGYCAGKRSTDLVSIVCGSGSRLALVARGELGEVTVVVTLPMIALSVAVPPCHDVHRCSCLGAHIHLVVKDLALTSLGLGDEALVKDVENILADLLELELDLLAVLADDTNVLVGALSLLLLLDAGDDAPRGTAGADDVLVGDGKKVALVNCELAANLDGDMLVGLAAAYRAASAL